MTANIGASITNTKRGHRRLHRAKNPDSVYRHAAARFIEDCEKEGIKIIENDEGILEAKKHIRNLCRSSKEIRKGKNCFILENGNWYLFYRDRCIVSVMHKQANRRA